MSELINYTDSHVVGIARKLLGMKLSTHFDGNTTSGIIVETEAYEGIIDKASHAYGERRTARTSTLYEAGGIAYVYLCYGLHHLFNVVTSVAGQPHAVLIRAIEPIEGIDIMLARRRLAVLKPNITAGPGALSQALGITTEHTGSKIGSSITITPGITIEEEAIASGTRVGVAYAEEHALWPYRFWIRGNKYVSKSKGLKV